MRDFIDRLDLELERMELIDVMTSSSELHSDLILYELELEELTGAVPIWARAVILVDTDDETAARAARERIDTTRSLLDELGRDLDARMKRVGEMLPPFGVALDVERVVRQIYAILFDRDGGSRTHPTGRAKVYVSLDRLAERVFETWVPDVDLDALAALSLDVDLARRLAHAPPPTFEHDAYTWWRPISHDQLAIAVAQRLLNSGYFERVAQASAAVDPDVRHYQLEVLQHEAAAAIAVFPPLAVASATRELRGAVDALTSRKVPTLVGSGIVVDSDEIAHAGVVCAATQVFLDTLAEVFDGMPMPSAYTGEVPPAMLRGTHDAWLAPLYDALDASEASAALAATVSHASMASVLNAANTRNASKITSMDRLVFWSDTPEEEREKELTSRRGWHLEMLRRWSEQFEEIVEFETLAHPYLGVRAGLIALYSAVDAISTDARPRKGVCGLYGVPEAQAAIDHVYAHLARHFGTVGSREELLLAVDLTLARGHHAGVPPTSFAVLSRDEVVARVAGYLAATNFHGSFTELKRLETSLAEKGRRHSQAVRDVSLWDIVNVFSRSEDEQAIQTLEGDMGDLRGRIAAFAHIDELFERALLHVYPPASIAYALSGVSHAIHSIRPVCQSRRTNGSRDVDYCDLVGAEAAHAAARGLNRRFLRAWGRLPDNRAVVMGWANRVGSRR